MQWRRGGEGKNKRRLTTSVRECPGSNLMKKQIDRQRKGWEGGGLGKKNDEKTVRKREREQPQTRLGTN